MEANDGSTAANTQSQSGSSGTYVLRELLNDISLSGHEDSGEEAHITCVDHWNGNLYIGTSAGEVLHYVSIQADPSDQSGQPSYIFATKLEPSYTTKQQGQAAGVRQILLLPDQDKACILCNGTLTFYTLPELSPAFSGKFKLHDCIWVGGLDANEDGVEQDHSGGKVIVICLKQRLRLVRLASDARIVRNIELGGISAIKRRGNLACVADGNTYSLLDVVNHRKIDLFSILPPSEPVEEKPLPEPPQAQPSSRGLSRSFSAAGPRPAPPKGHSHERNVSLGEGLGSSTAWPSRASSRQVLSPVQPASREASPKKSGDSSPRPSTDVSPKPEAATPLRLLPPNIATPTPNEFLITTGTQLSEPGIGMFVNMEGDPSRPPITFSSYPHSLVLEGSGPSAEPTIPGGSGSAGYVLALVRKQVAEGVQRVIEIQRWDDDPSEVHRSKEWLVVESVASTSSDDEENIFSGLHLATSTTELAVPEISASLRQRRLALLGEADDTDTKRNAEEDKFVARFAHVQASVLCFTRNKISWVTRNPLIVQLGLQLGSMIQQNNATELSTDVAGVQRVINSIRGQEAGDELEFLTLSYTRQRASLLLFGNLLSQTSAGKVSSERDKRSVEEALVAGEIDPRVVLSLVPPLTDEIKEGENGIWVPQGLRDTVELLRRSFDKDKIVQDPRGAYGENLLAIIKPYLFAWRKKKGLASVADEVQVFRSVDAALLHVLLLLDQHSPRGPAKAGSVRAELNDVVDRGVECFDRAVELFEQFSRLYMLSRLYQSRKIPSRVLATWKRIMEGEHDAGGELIEGEQDLRRYLTKIRDHALVQEYGAWLANRNPKLGAQVFADDSSRVKFQPSEAVAILKESAPGAVKEYLEHLVFGKNHVQYVNDLIAFYLDTVVTELENSDEAKTILLESYEDYRALQPPKPTYRQFITDNVVDTEWWHSRLRLLQLIGGSHGAASKYDVHALGQRLAPYSNELVPEMIILNGREGKHEEALRLLTHGLGDYDTAVRYCLRGGSSIFHPTSGLGPEQPLPTKEEQARLFEYLLREFFQIEDLSERLLRTAELLERFGAWFDIAHVLEMIPERWSVKLVEEFLVHALRRLVRERNESTIAKALSSAQNLIRSVEIIEKREAGAPTVVTAEIDAT